MEFAEIEFMSNKLEQVSLQFVALGKLWITYLGLLLANRDSDGLHGRSINVLLELFKKSWLNR